MPRDSPGVSWYCCLFTQPCHWLNSSVSDKFVHYISSLFMCAAVSISETCFCWWLEDFCKIKRVWKPKILCVHHDSCRRQHRGRPRASQRILPFQSIRRYRLTRSSVKGWNSLKANCTFIFIQVFFSYMKTFTCMTVRSIFLDFQSCPVIQDRI